MRKKIIAASILAADFAYLANDVNAVLQCGVEYVHFDVMDHHYVPNLTFGAGICSALRHAGIQAPIDVHLMVDHPEMYIEPFAKAGANIITFHPETVTDVESVIKKINNAGMEAGLVFNPHQSVEISINIARQLKMILLMSVNPGFGGQSFMPSILEKAKQTRQWLDNYKIDIWLAVDGGIKVENIGLAAEAGFDYFVVGSGLFAAEDYAERVSQLRRVI